MMLTNLWSNLTLLSTLYVFMRTAFERLQYQYPSTCHTRNGSRGHTNTQRSFTLWHTYE